MISAALKVMRDVGDAEEEKENVEEEKENVEEDLW